MQHGIDEKLKNYVNIICSSFIEKKNKFQKNIFRM